MAPTGAGGRVLVTGGTGFLGQHVAQEFRTAGHEIFSIGKDHFDLHFESEALSAVLAAKPDIIVHLAAPVEELEDVKVLPETLHLGLNVIHAAALSGARLVMLSRSSLRHKETREALFSVARSYRKKHKLVFSMLLANQAYGPFDRFDGLSHSRAVAFILTRLMMAKTVEKEIHFPGEPKSSLALFYAGDLAKAVLEAAALSGCDEPIVLMPEEIESLDGVFRQAAEIVGYKKEIHFQGKESFNWSEPLLHDGIPHSQVLDWKPAIGLKKGLELTMEWLSSAAKKKEASK